MSTARYLGSDFGRSGPPTGATNLFSTHENAQNPVGSSRTHTSVVILMARPNEVPARNGPLMHGIRAA